MKLHSVTGALRPRPPFDFTKSLEFLGMFAPAQAEQTLTDRSLTKATRVGNATTVFRVESTGTVKRPSLRYALFAARPISPAAAAAAAERIAFFLSLDDDLRPFYAVARRDRPFASIVEQFFGYHQVKFLTPFENACWAVLSQHNYLAVARKMKDALVHAYGTSLTVDGVTYLAFPGPVEVARVSEGDLASVVRNGQRGRYLRAVAQAFDGVDEAFLRTASYDGVEAWLRTIPGIGPWSAAFILIRSLGRMDRIAFTEKALGRAVAKVYGRGKPLNRDVVERIVKRYGPWQGYWAHYLRAATAWSPRR